MTTLTPDPATTTAPRRLLEKLAAGTPFALAFGGQGTEWLEPLAGLVRTHGLELGEVIVGAERLVQPVSGELLRSGSRFAPIEWLDATELDDGLSPTDAMLAAPSAAVPGILLTQIAGLRALHGLGLDPDGAVAVAGHSQGRIAERVVNGLPEIEALAYARLAGAAAELVARRRGLLGAAMVSVDNITRAELEEALSQLPEPRPVIGLQNGRRSFVVTGPPASVEKVADLLPHAEPVAAVIAFHHPALAEAAELVGEWAARCGLDADTGRELTLEALVDPVDWVSDVTELLDAGARWILDVGPGDLTTRLTAGEAKARGVGVLALGTRRGLRELTIVGAAPRRARAWQEYAPRTVRLPDGRVRVETAFTRLTGRSPILLAGMTPTTVDPAIVAAAANAGFWAELAGGGQVSEPIFAENTARLAELLDPGHTYAFNALLLDPYLWRLHVAGSRLVQSARATGSPVDAVVVSAGIPEFDDAVALVHDLHDAGIEYIVFKPGTEQQIRQVLAIAADVAPIPMIVQVEGGKAGGHHSWENLDDLLIGSYARLRQHENVVVCVGGGIGTPESAVRYLTGEWSRDLGHPAMPLDGVLVGTAAMACLEATTSPDVKQLLVESGPDDVVSGRSQLGADIHEIANAAARTGSLLDEVAGDADAVRERRAELVAALNRTAKPYFGDAEKMTYGQWLARFLELAGSPGWLDVTVRDRFHSLLQRAEARLHAADRGPIDTLFPASADVEDGAAALQALRERHPAADDVLLHPADVAYFIAVCRRAGKPVPFVPVIDADVRKWWRSDSLWQAHDPRYGADAVSVIPGPDSIAGITRADEPVADLLARFEQAVVDSVQDEPVPVDGLRRADGAAGLLALALAAPDAVWGTRTVTNPVHRLGDSWRVVDASRAEHPETGAWLTDIGDQCVELGVPIRDGAICLHLRIDDAVAAGAAPVVVNANDAMTALLDEMAGRRESGDPVVWHPDLVADHMAVTAGTDASIAVPDVLVGLVWPTVFAALSARDDVVDGVLDLLHLDHAIAGLIPDQPTALDVSAEVVDVADLSLGRVATVDVRLRDGGQDIARLTERFVLRGRPGSGELPDPASAGGRAAESVETPRRTIITATVESPRNPDAFAAVTGDHNPIHTSLAAAKLAGLGEPIMHGMWVSAAAQRVVSEETGRALSGWTGRFLAPVLPGDAVQFRAVRIGLVEGDELIEVVASVGDTRVLMATGRLAAPRTAYVFPGQGIQSAGMGMAAYARSREAREIWDRADAHTMAVLGFSILEVVRDNPTELKVGAVTHRHPDGVLFLTQFTQVAMAVLAAAQVAELRESGAFVDGALLAGHSVGEYNALAAISGALSLEAVVEVVFQRGSLMHELVERDEQGRSNYRLAAIRPAQFELDDADVQGFVERIGADSGEFLQVVNYNLRGSQYAIAGTVRGLELLEAEVERRRAAVSGRAAFVLVPGIDVPFHSDALRAGVGDFRARLDELLPAEIEPAPLVGLYIPNLVARPFALDADFMRAILEVVPSEPVEAVLADLPAWSGRDGELARVLLIELLAWQFASPVRWIETQDLLFASPEAAGLGVQRLIEIGVGSAPTLANLAAATLKLPEVRRTMGGHVEILNLERDAGVATATDSDPSLPEDSGASLSGDTPDPEAQRPESSARSEPEPAAVAGGADVADLVFGAADAAPLLLAWWSKVRPDQLDDSDSIEALCDGASSRRNQMLMDLGTELSLGAIDGAAEAPLSALGTQIETLARGYRPFGPVLSVALADHLKKVLGPAGAKQAAIAERVRSHWGLGSGWATHTTVALATATREGTSVRGGDLGGTPGPANSADVDAAIDAAVHAVAARRGIAVSPPAAADDAVDPAAVAGLTRGITDALASTARHLLAQIGDQGAVAAVADGADDRDVVARVEAELGSDWIAMTAPAFDARRAVLFDDRWASAREDVVRLAAGESVTGSFDGTGPAVAAIARWHGLGEIARAAESEEPGAWSDDVAVVTGASRGSIAAEVVGDLLSGGATVIATTSRLDDERLAFFRELYRGRARAGAHLWVVPANMASFADVDALVAWVTERQERSMGPRTELLKAALRPTLLFPFAAGRVLGAAADAGSRAEVEARILLWSVERLVGADWRGPIHAVLPGSPNRGTFGGDGAYGEAKAALDALVTKWSAERSWADQVTLAHPIIGWVRGTGLMGGNDPLVAAVEGAGVRTWSTEEMADELLKLATPEAREAARTAPLRADLSGGLDGVDLRALTPPAHGVDADESEVDTILALPPSPAPIADWRAPEWPELSAGPEDLVVIVGTGELGPYGSARTRAQMEVDGALSAAGVLELAWITGLVRWDAAAAGWYDVESGDVVDESEIADRYEDTVVERCGIRPFSDDGTMQDHTAPLLASVFLEHDVTFTVGSEAEAHAFATAAPDSTRVTASGDGEWQVTRLAGSQIRVPRRLSMTRTAGGQIPDGFDPTVWGIGAELAESVDRVALWNLVCTVDAFLSSGFSPDELLRWVHPAHVANTQGTGLGGMTSMQSLYLDTLMGEPVANDLLQEALPNVIAAHVMQSYVGGYGAMVHPVAACATTAVSIEEGVDKIRLGKAQFVVAGGYDDLGTEGVVGFANMSATADTAAMAAQGIEPRRLSRANDRRRGGFVESQGGGTILLTRGDVAARMGLPVLGVVAYAGSFADGLHTSIPAPGIGALAAALGGADSPLARSLADLGLGADDIAVVSKHDTSTAANDPNESDIHERLAEALGRSTGNPLLVISQKSLTGHAKGGAAAFQVVGLTQVLSGGVVPPNRSLDCVDPALAEHERLVWLRQPLVTGPLRAGLVTSLGFGHVAGLIAIAHPEAFVATLPRDERHAYRERAHERLTAGALRRARVMLGEPGYARPRGRRLGASGDAHELEAAVLLDPSARLAQDGVFACR